MRRWLLSSLAIFTAATILVACQPDENKAATAPETAWPVSLKVMGDGFPNPGDACRRIGETQATVNYLDHTATLAGCRSAADAAKLGGTILGTVDGVMLVSVPTDTAQLGQ